jgi:thymidylate synthase
MINLPVISQHYFGYIREEDTFTKKSIMYVNIWYCDEWKFISELTKSTSEKLGPIFVSNGSGWKQKSHKVNHQI